MDQSSEAGILKPGLILRSTGLEFGMAVADFGCGGTGPFTMEAAKIAGNQGKVYAVDILKSSLSALMARVRLAGYTNVIPVWSNLERFGAAKAIHDGSVDFGIVANALYQSSHPEAVLKEVFRTLKGGGRALVIEWNTGRATIGPTEKELVPADQIRSYLEKLGARELEFFDAGLYHYGMVIEKVGRAPSS
ncbi:MAG: class I SAM-dependent methyltransferase [Candidatus Nomurabacteria bacterium]|nr:MAG: class I SAM-dependent methyltransferase [Candidatus Nomurabacteria bacterium]